MNQNPTCPNNINKLMSECFSPSQEEEPQHKKAEKEIISEVFEK